MLLIVRIVFHFQIKYFWTSCLSVKKVQNSRTSDFRNQNGGWKIRAFLIVTAIILARTEPTAHAPRRFTFTHSSCIYLPTYLRTYVLCRKKCRVDTVLPWLVQPVGSCRDRGVQFGSVTAVADSRSHSDFDRSDPNLDRFSLKKESIFQNRLIKIIG